MRSERRTPGEWLNTRRIFRRSVSHPFRLRSGSDRCSPSRGPRSGLSRQCLGYRFQGRCADQGVRPDHGGGFYDVHHELGHNFYQRAYTWPSCSATVRTMVSTKRSATRCAFRHAGVSETNRPDRHGSACLRRYRLLLHERWKRWLFPFGLLVDKWRWKVFSGEIKPADYNKAWWEFRLKYQGIAPPVARSRFRSRRQVSRSQQRSVRAVFPG